MWETPKAAQSAVRRLCGIGDSVDGYVDRSHIACSDVAEELQGQVHRFGMDPTNVGLRRAELGDQSRQLLFHVSRQIYGGEKAHGNHQDGVAFGPR